LGENVGILVAEGPQADVEFNQEEYCSIDKGISVFGAPFPVHSGSFCRWSVHHPALKHVRDCIEDLYVILSKSTDDSRMVRETYIRARPLH
jgi:hypothetical protein